MDVANLRLSPTEMDLVTNADWILTKNEIISKVKALFAGLSHDMIVENFDLHPKISRGENYRGLPFVMLDYPRQFDKENVCAIRTLFWWGNFFSLTLHLAGSFKEKYAERIIEKTGHWKENDFYYCINDDPWEHHFEKNNYSAVNSEFAGFVSNHPFLKLAKKYPLNKWEQSIALMKQDYQNLVDLLT